MKNFILGVFFTFVLASISFAQLLDNINTVESFEKEEISRALLHFEKAINTGDLLELPDVIRTNVLKERENSKTYSEFENIQINYREITLGKDSATVTGTYFFCYDTVRSEEQNYTIHLIKKFKWEIRSAEGITKNLAHIKIQNKSKTSYTLSLNTMHFSETTMQQIPWSSSLLGTFWRINYLDAINYLGEAILSADCEIDGDVYYDSNNKRVGIFLDPCCREIVYSLEGRNETSIYRDLDVLENPVSISVNQWGEIFVVDAGKHCIMKLQFDENTHKIVPANATTPFVDIKFEDRNPLDIDYYYNQTENKADDIIAVTYPNNNRIAFYRSDGSLITRIHNYSVAGSGPIEFDSPCKVLLFKSGTLKIAVIQKDKKQLLIGRLDLTAGTITCTNDPVDSENPIYQLGRDISNNILATSYFIDISFNRIAGVVHKFDEYGKYSCSFNPYGFTFNKLYTISDICEQRIFRSNQWSNDIVTGDIFISPSGYQRFLPGADILDFQHVTDRLSMIFRFKPTDHTIYTAELIRSSDNSIIYSEESFAQSGFYRAVSFNHLRYLNSGDYKWRVNFSPLTNDENFYPMHVDKAYPFTYTMHTPEITNFVQEPSIIYHGGTGTVICYANYDFGNVSYTWGSQNLPDGASVSYSGPIATITYEKFFKSFTKKDNWNKEKFLIPRLTCTVTNESGQETKSVNLNFWNPPGGCPFVYTWNNTVWTEDNNILPQSQDEGQRGVLTDDYYNLYTKPVLTADETYRLAIGEFEQEQSFIDLTKLIIVDHPLETDITVDDSGRVFQFAKPAFFASAQMDTLDVLKMLFAPDSVTVEAEANSKLEMSFQGTSQGTEKWMVLAAHTMAKDKKTGIVKSKNSEAFSDFRLRRNQSFVWVPVHQDSVSTVMVDVLWKESSTIDYAELSQKLELPFTVTVPELLSAEHSEEGDVMQKLLVEDGDVMTLSPNQWVTLDFRAPRLAEGMERSFIFASKGYYQLYQNNKANTSGVNDKNIVSEKPKDYALMQNSPNPFNPSTVIQYQLPKDGQVKITLFDILGREVMVLVDDYKTAGSYSYQFNADRLSSGVYIYRMDCGNFHTSKKLTLLK